MENVPIGKLKSYIMTHLYTSGDCSYEFGFKSMYLGLFVE